jgi:hypothetical protein
MGPLEVCALSSKETSLIHTPPFGFGGGGGIFSIVLLVKSMPTLELGPLDVGAGLRQQVLSFGS